MLSIYSNERGSALWLLVFVIVVVFGMYTLSKRVHIFGIGDDSNVNEATTSAIEIVDAKNDNSTTKSFQTVNGYDSSRGKAVITDDKFGNFAISIAAVMPSEFPGTYYQAKMVGVSGISDVDLGKMNKVGGSFVANYTSARVINDYNKVVISVDGEAATVEGKTLPHDVMVLDL